MYGDQFGEFLCGYWGLKGYRDIPSERNKAATQRSQNVPRGGEQWASGFIRKPIWIKIWLNLSNALTLSTQSKLPNVTVTPENISAPTKNF